MLLNLRSTGKHIVRGGLPSNNALMGGAQSVKAIPTPDKVSFNYGSRSYKYVSGGDYLQAYENGAFKGNYGRNNSTRKTIEKATGRYHTSSKPPVTPVSNTSKPELKPNPSKTFVPSTTRIQAEKKGADMQQEKKLPSWASKLALGVGTAFIIKKIF